MIYIAFSAGSCIIFTEVDPQMKHRPELAEVKLVLFHMTDLGFSVGPKSRSLWPCARFRLAKRPREAMLEKVERSGCLPLLSQSGKLLTERYLRLLAICEGCNDSKT